MRAIVKKILKDSDGSFCEAVNKTNGISSLLKANISIGDDLGEWHDKKCFAAMVTCPDGNSYLVEAA